MTLLSLQHWRLFYRLESKTLPPSKLYLAPMLRVSTKAVSSSLRFAASSTCLPFPTWITLHSFGFYCKPISCIAALVDRSTLFSLVYDETNTQGRLPTVIIIIIAIGVKTRSITLRLCRLFLIDSKTPPSPAKLCCALIGSKVRFTRGEVRFEEAVVARSSTTLKYKIIKSHYIRTSKKGEKVSTE